MKRRSKAIGTSAIILIAVLLTAVVLFATLQTDLTTESARNEQNPLYVQSQSIVQVRLGKSATANNVTFRVQNVMNGTDPEARQVWATYDTDHYAPLNPVQGSTYVIINATVASAINGTSPFRYSDVVCVGNDGRSVLCELRRGQRELQRLACRRAAQAWRRVQRLRRVFCS